MLWRALFLTALAVAANGQAVVSTRSGVVHYFEGSVYLNDQPLAPHLGKFASMASGDQLRTGQGRAEVLLTPGVFLRIDQNSTIRMVSNSFEDTRVELLNGSATIEAPAPQAGTAVTMGCQDWQIHFLDQGSYRVDFSPARLWVADGQAEVADPASGTPVTVANGQDLPLASALVAEQTTSMPNDSLANWSRGRQDSISADNQIAANIQDPATIADQDPLAAVAADGYATNGFTQFPLIGLAPPITANPYPYGAAYGGVYNPLYPYQPGFYSLYLPGYTYMPLFLALPTRVVPNGLRSLSTSRPGVPTVMPLSGINSPRVGAPIGNSIGRPIGGIVRPYSPPVLGSPNTVVRPSAPVVVTRPAAPPVVRAPVAAPRGVGGAHR